jgi:membrane-associated phospholipid phosphatase
MSFMWATVLSRNYGLKVGLPAYAVAGYVGATRLQENKHHMTDIVAGATIGYIVGRTVTRRSRGGRWSRVNWMVAPAGRGFVASLSFPGP